MGKGGHDDAGTRSGSQADSGAARTRHCRKARRVFARSDRARRGRTRDSDFDHLEVSGPSALAWDYQTHSQSMFLRTRKVTSPDRCDLLVRLRSPAKRSSPWSMNACPLFHHAAERQRAFSRGANYRGDAPNVFVSVMVLRGPTTVRAKSRCRNIGSVIANSRSRGRTKIHGASESSAPAARPGERFSSKRKCGMRWQAGRCRRGHFMPWMKACSA